MLRAAVRRQGEPSSAGPDVLFVVIDARNERGPGDERLLGASTIISWSRRGHGVQEPHLAGFDFVNGTENLHASFGLTCPALG